MKFSAISIGIVLALVFSVVGVSAQSLADIELTAETITFEGRTIQVRSESYYDDLVQKCKERIKPQVDAKECAGDINGLRLDWRLFIKNYKAAQGETTEHRKAFHSETAQAWLNIAQKKVPYLHRAFAEIFTK